MLWIGIVLISQVVITIGLPNLRNTEVCGTDGLTYKDVDELESARMETTDLELLYYGACDLQDQILRENRTVFCGSDNKTYNSYLELLVQKFKTPDLMLKHAGPCEDKKQNVTSPKKENITSLRTDDTSVCATDFRTYEDFEEFESAQMVYPDLRMLHSGQCVMPMLFKSGHLRCIGCLFGGWGQKGAKSSCGGNGGTDNKCNGGGNQGNGGGNECNGGGNQGNGGGNCGGNGNDPLTQNLNQIAKGVFDIVGGSLAIGKDVELGQKGCST